MRVFSRKMMALPQHGTGRALRRKGIFHMTAPLIHLPSKAEKYPSKLVISCFSSYCHGDSFCLASPWPRPACSLRVARPREQHPGWGMTPFPWGLSSASALWRRRLLQLWRVLTAAAPALGRGFAGDCPRLTGGWQRQLEPVKWARWGFSLFPSF